MNGIDLQNNFCGLFKNNKMKSGFQNGFPNGENQNQNQQLNNFLNMFTLAFNSNGFPQRVNMISPPIFSPPFNWNNTNLQYNTQVIQNEKPEIQDKNTTSNVLSGLQIQKKMKLPRCSVCLKKIQLQQLFKCQKCIKTFHKTCQDLQQRCSKCQEKDKLRQLKRDKKIVKKAEKMNNFKSSNDPFHSQSHSIYEKTQLSGQALKFAKKFPYYISGNHIIYPVQDSLFALYPKVLKADSTNCISQNIELPLYYGDLLQMWNIIITFPLYFGVDPEIKIKEIQQKMISDQISPQFFNILLKFASFNQYDLLYDKYEQLRDSQHFAYISLIKFCLQSNFLDKVMKFTWPKFIRKIFEILIKEKIDQKVNEQVIKQIILMDNNAQFKFFKNKKDRFQFVRSLCSNIVQTNYFRTFLNEKSQNDKQNNKQKNELLDAKKSSENKLNTIKQKQRDLLKQYKRAKKMIKNNQAQGDLLLKQIQKQQEQLNGQKQQIIDAIKQIDTQIDSVTGFNGFSNISLIGKDKDKNLYWITLEHKDRFFVSKGNKWSYIPVKKLPQFLNSLNKNGIRQRQLYQTLSEYKGFSQQSTQKIENEDLNAIKQSITIKNTVSDENGFNFLNLTNISIENIRVIILEGQRRITRYLQQRNARWANPQQRARYIQSISKAISVQQFITQIKPFNEKICVVQVQYKIILQDSAQQIDSKTRKIQTKIWGINQKYKHNWYDFAKQCVTLSDLFFLVSVQYLNIEKYVGKMRKLRKQYQEVKGPTNHIKTKCARSDGTWEDQCQLCNGIGDLLCCDSCPKVFHIQCIGIKSLPYDQFKCQACLKKRNTRSQAKRLVNQSKRN